MTPNGHLTADQRAAAEFLGPYWAKAEPRNAAAGALAGGLLRAGWPVETVEHFIEAVAEVAQDEEAQKRVAWVAKTAEKLKKKAKVSGFPSLARVIGADGDNVVHRLRRTL